MPDLRTWLDDVNKFGQLMNVENVAWNLELSTLTEIINERTKIRPAIASLPRITIYFGCKLQFRDTREYYQARAVRAPSSPAATMKQICSYS